LKDRLIPQMHQISKMLRRNKDPPDSESKRKRESKLTRLTATLEIRLKFLKLSQLDYLEQEDTKILF
jgi:hypothetical protein